MRFFAASSGLRQLLPLGGSGHAGIAVGALQMHSDGRACWGSSAGV